MIYIEADKLSDGLYQIQDGQIHKYKAKGGTVRTYEMGEIVRCKDCKHRREICPMRYIEIVGEDERIYDYSTDNGYCSWGERREGGDDE